MNNRVVLINSFCDKQTKLDILEKNIKIIKSNNLDVILLSPINLPQYIIELCDVFIQTKENQSCTKNNQKPFCNPNISRGTFFTQHQNRKNRTGNKHHKKHCRQY
jgi:hypothetical protein